MVQQFERARPPGRNDPCPCGSGKKYKRCCLSTDGLVPQVRRLEDVLADLRDADAGGDCDGAIRILEEAREGLHDPELDSLLAERYADLPIDRAEVLLRRWWDLRHDRCSGTELARLLIRADRKDEAFDVLVGSSGSEGWPEYWRLLAGLRDERGDVAGAIAAMELCTRLAPEASESWETLSHLQMRLGQVDRALQSLRRAGDLLPDHIEPRMARLRIQAGAGRWRETRDLAEALLEGQYVDTNLAVFYELRNLLARSYFVLGYFDAARRLWENLLQERPDDVEVCHGLATLELSTGRHGRVLALLEPRVASGGDARLRDIYIRSLLVLHEFDEAARIAREMDPGEGVALLSLVQARAAIANREYAWALEQLSGEPPEMYRDLWHNLRLDCLAHLAHWQEMWPVLREITRADDAVLARAALGAMAAGKLDLVERLLAKIDDQQGLEARSLGTLLGPIRQSRRAAEVRRQQQVDQAEKQRWAVESRDLRRRIRDLEGHNAALADALAISESSMERLLERMGILSEDSGPNWEAHVQGMADRAHRDALAEDLRQAERRLRDLLGDGLWMTLSESTRASLREGEWLYEAVKGEDRDYGSSLLEYARGLERAFKDAIFVPARAAWERHPGPVERLHDEVHDPSLGPFIRYVLHGGHLTLGSMATALDRMSDGRRQGTAINLLRGQLGIDPADDRELADWKRTAEQLARAACARNQPAHAAAVSRAAVCAFRNLVLGTDGLLRALHGR